MSRHPPRRTRPRRLRALACIGALAIAACDARTDRTADTPRPPARPDFASRASANLADSARGDSAALASLPRQQRADFDVLDLLAEESLRDTARARCQVLSDSAEAELRIRLRARDRDSLAVILFVRADRATAAIGRVELARRTSARGQRAYLWDEATAELRALEWQAGQREPYEYTIPAGTPTPRALRALGRRLLAIPCTGRLGDG